MEHETLHDLDAVVLFEPTPNLEIPAGFAQLYFVLQYATYAQKHVVARASAQMSLLQQILATEKPAWLGRLRLFEDWMAILGHAQFGTLEAASAGDELTGLAERVGCPHRIVPKLWGPATKGRERRSRSLKRVALMGPESSGKTTLAAALATRLNAVYVEEYIRALLQFRGTSTCGAHEVAAIVYAQAALEETWAWLNCGQEFLICDTEPRQSAIWSSALYGKVDEQVVTFCDARSYDLYLVTKNNLPWIPDGQRCLPHGGDDFFDRCLKAVQRTGVPYVVIDGVGDMRTAQALDAIAALDL